MFVIWGALEMTSRSRLWGVGLIARQESMIGVGRQDARGQSGVL
jgi:hypothetical protein